MMTKRYCILFIILCFLIFIKYFKEEMKILKNTIIVIISLVVIVLIIAAFVPSEFKVEREVTINKPLTEVFDYVKYLKNQENYSVWSKIDPNMKREFIGVD